MSAHIWHAGETLLLAWLDCRLLEKAFRLGSLSLRQLGEGRGEHLNVWVQIPNLLLCGWGGSGKFSGSLQPAFPPVKMEAIMKVGVSMK